ncbi:Chromatin structure remodeling complex protein sfh1 [Steccherinum ochraceum]|uniref:Chromatin structure remodeling complex protein sfh1 n=1 Tax=Steccherinum ochraceum TaxID=92696 RepID=A0A4R0RVM3_9APHY|nr:Chromatin structure remodeling complex protein sfh1 [Steccherinum ochraceum]
MAGFQGQPPTPGQIHPSYMNNIRQWSNSATPPPANGRTNPSRRSRPQRGSSLVPQQPPLPPPTAQPVASTSTYQYQPAPPPMAAPVPVQNPAPVRDPYANPYRTPIPTHTQALHSTYASRLRTGTTLLLQPILSNPTVGGTTTATRSTRRGGAAINYADPGSGDEFPDAGALDSDDSDFVASGGTRSAIRNARVSRNAPTGAGVFHSGTMTPTVVHTPQPAAAAAPAKNELDQSYLGRVPPSKFIVSKPVAPTRHEYFLPEQLDSQARRLSVSVPIRVEFETDTHRIRDCFIWNLNEGLIAPEVFARIFCADLDLPQVPWAETVATQIRAQLEEHDAVAALDMNVHAISAVGLSPHPGEEIPECRVMLSIDVQIATHHLQDHIEWDLLSDLTPEAFSLTLCAELGLAGEAVPLIAHAIHEELVKHKRDVLEWGVLSFSEPSSSSAYDAERPRDKSGLSLMKDKTGLGLGWGRTPKDGRGPKALRSVWRDWPEAEEFRTRFEVLSAEEVERREVERERASRRLRRETSKFQTAAATAPVPSTSALSPNEGIIRMLEKARDEVKASPDYVPSKLASLTKAINRVRRYGKVIEDADEAVAVLKPSRIGHGYEKQDLDMEDEWKRNEEVHVAARELAKIPGIGPKLAMQLASSGCLSEEQLMQPRFLKTLKPSTQIALQWREAKETEVTELEANTIADFIRDLLPSKFEVVLVGSHRRGQTSKCINVVLFHPSYVYIPTPSDSLNPTFSRRKLSTASKISIVQDIQTPLEHRGALVAVQSLGLRTIKGYVRIPERDGRGAWESRWARANGIKDKTGQFRFIEIKCVLSVPLMSFHAFFIGDDLALQHITDKVERRHFDQLHGRPGVHRRYEAKREETGDAPRRVRALEMATSKLKPKFL